VRRELCAGFWLATHDGVQPFDGDLDDYQKWLQEQSKQVAQAAKKARDQGKKAAKAQPAQPKAKEASADERKAAQLHRQKLQEQAKPLKNDLKKVEQRMATLTTERDQLSESLGDAKLSATARADQSKRFKIVSDEVESLEHRWLELSDAIEKLNPDAA